MNYTLFPKNIYDGLPSAVSEGPAKILSAFLPKTDISKCIIIPGLADVHVHLREPGFLYKETIKTGTLAAARGGFTTVLAMPNLSPVPDCISGLTAQLEVIARDASVQVIPYGAISIGRRGEALSEMESIASRVCAFSDDGSGVQSEALMKSAMLKAKSLNKIIAAHCEDTTLLHGGCIHDSTYDRANGLTGISSESEWRQVERDIDLAAETGCAYHVCHISTRESASLIRIAKKRGVNITCETAPHYLLLDEDDIKDDGRFKMNPPLRSRTDRLALTDALLDGTIDMIATDHAPHSADEKAGGLVNSAMGIVGLETAFPLLYTRFVRTGMLTLERLTQLMCDAPRRRFSLAPNGFAVFDITTPHKINPDEFRSKGRATPFAGKTVYARCLMTVSDGKIAWREQNA